VNEMTDAINENINPEQTQPSSEVPENLNEEKVNETPDVNDTAVTSVIEEAPIEKIELQVNEEALKEQNQLFETLKKEVEALKSDLNTMDEIKHERKSMAELKEKLLSLFLISKTERDEYVDIIQSKFEILKETSDKIKNEINAKLDENLKIIEPKVHEVLKEAENPENFTEIRKKLIDIQNELKDFELHRDRKDDFFSLVQKAFESLNEKQDLEREKYEMEISENYLNIKPKVAEAIKFAVQTDNYNQAREKLIECQNELKKLKLKKDHLDELFGLIRIAFENVNQKQDTEREELKEKSVESYNEIKPIVTEAVSFADSTDDYESARKRLIETQKAIKEKVLTRSQRDELYGAVREVFNRLNEKQDSNRGEFLEECNNNFARLEVSVNEACAYIDFTNDLNDIREGLIAVQDEVKIVKLTRTQRNELFKRIRVGFGRFDEKRNEFIKSRKKHKKEQLEEKLESKVEKVEKIEDVSIKDKIQKEIEETQSKIENIENEINKLEE
jgi:hypothetical protein